MIPKQQIAFPIYIDITEHVKESGYRFGYLDKDIEKHVAEQGLEMLDAFLRNRAVYHGYTYSVENCEVRFNKFQKPRITDKRTFHRDGSIDVEPKFELLYHAVMTVNFHKEDYTDYIIII